MCTQNIMIIFIELAGLLNNLMHANFIAVDNELNKKIANLPWADKISSLSDSKSDATYSTQEISIMAQKAFLLLCDLYKLDPANDSDIMAIQQASVYGTMLSRVISTMPNFKRSEMEIMVNKSYTEAVQSLEKRQLFNMKNDLMICRNLIYDNAITSSDTNSGTTNNSYTIDVCEHWTGLNNDTAK